MRKLQDDLYKYIRNRVAFLGAYKEAVDSKDARSLVIIAAQALVGVHEVGGNNRGPIVELIQKTVDGVAGGEAWCMAMAQSCIAFAEVTTGIKSPIVSSEGCLYTFNKTPIEQRVRKIPLPGAIVIWQHGNTAQGHTGIVTASDGEIVETVEGNTDSGIGDNGSIVRDGGGVYRNRRPFLGVGNMHLVGFLKPF